MVKLVSCLKPNLDSQITGNSDLQLCKSWASKPFSRGKNLNKNLILIWLCLPANIYLKDCSTWYRWGIILCSSFPGSPASSVSKSSSTRHVFIWLTDMGAAAVHWRMWRLCWDVAKIPTNFEEKWKKIHQNLKLAAEWRKHGPNPVFISHFTLFPRLPWHFFLLHSGLTQRAGIKTAGNINIIWHFSGGPESCIWTRAGIQKGGSATGTENQWDCEARSHFARVADRNGKVDVVIGRGAAC